MHNDDNGWLYKTTCQHLSVSNSARGDFLLEDKHSRHHILRMVCQAHASYDLYEITFQLDFFKSPSAIS